MKLQRLDKNRDKPFCTVTLSVREAEMLRTVLSCVDVPSDSPGPGPCKSFNELAAALDKAGAGFRLFEAADWPETWEEFEELDLEMD